MHLRNKIGQMLIMGFSGCEIEPCSSIAKWLQDDGLGGVLLFDYDLHTQSYGKNLKDGDQIKRLTTQLKRYASASDWGQDQLPLFIALDYEGGAVDRLSKIEGCMTTMKASEQALLSEGALHKEALRMAKTLYDLGFNLNFAPVVDLNISDQYGIIGKLGRSFSDDPEVVIRVANQFVQAFCQYGIACAYKHFPGHGSAMGDTHLGFVDVTESYQSSELVPYASLLKDKSLPFMVMTAHVINHQLDDSGLPASLSHKVLTDLLRRKMGYDGVIVSDDLQMRAVRDHYSLEEALCLAINAGVDMIIFGNQLGSVSATDVIDCVEDLVYAGKITEALIEQAYQRISRLKQMQKVCWK